MELCGAGKGEVTNRNGSRAYGIGSDWANSLDGYSAKNRLGKIA